MEPAANQTPLGRSLGRYVVYDEFATGGMATVHFGRLRGQGGFSRTVAIKRLHAPYARDPHFVSMLVEEARLAARVQHPNVVAPLDVVAVDDQELLLVMEYIHGESLAKLIGCCARQSRRVPPQVAVSIMTGVLYGLHAAHEAVSDQGEPLNIVHRDVSPQNILVGADGVARVLDFGVAKASSRSPGTVPGTTKGKLSYMSPEQLRFKTIDRRADVFAAGVVLWEMLTLRRLFRSDDPGLVAMKILKSDVALASRFNPQVSKALDTAVASALARDRDARFGTALMFAKALEEAVTPATTREVGEWVAATTPEGLAQRSRLRARIESAAGREHAPPRPLSTEAASVPAPEDDSVTVRARAIDLGTLGGFRTSRDGLGQASLPLVQANDLGTLGGFRTSRDWLGQAKLPPIEALAEMPDVPPPPEAPTLVTLGPPPEVVAMMMMRDAPPPAPGVVVAPAVAAPSSAEVALADVVESIDIGATTPALAQEIEATPIRLWRRVPSRLWGALGIGAFALILALAMFLPRRTPEAPPAPTAVAPAPQAVPRLPAAPEVQALPGPQQPAPSPEPALQAAFAPEPEPAAPEPAPAPEPKAAAAPEPKALTAKAPARPRPPVDDSEPVVVLENQVDGDPEARPRRRWQRLRNKALQGALSGGNLDCDPPYLLDDRGIRRIKPECLTSP